jgi:hypothetical protein
MKKQLLVTLLAGVAATGAFAQGTISIDNINNVNQSATATSGGLFFQGPITSPTPYNGAFLNIELLGGASAGSLTPIATLTGPNGFVNGGGPGQFADETGATYTLAGVASQGTAFLEVEAWEGSFTSLAAAQAANAAWGITPVFQNPTGGPGTPPVLAQDLVGMPALVLNTPEPTTIALGGLGAAALMLFRRRK